MSLRQKSFFFKAEIWRPQKSGSRRKLTEIINKWSENLFYRLKGHFNRFQLMGINKNDQKIENNCFLSDFRLKI